MSNPNQYQGVAYIRVNGQELPTMEGATFTPSGSVREVVKGLVSGASRPNRRKRRSNASSPAVTESRFRISSPGITSPSSLKPTPAKST